MKKGFTLIELLGIIIILGVLTMLIAPNMVKVSNNTKNKLYTAKKKKIEGAAREFGYDNLDSFDNKDILYSTTPTTETQTYTIKKLIEEGYLSSEDKTTLKYENPTNGKNMINCEVYVWYYKSDKNASAATRNDVGKVMASLKQDGDCGCKGGGC